MDFKGGAVGYFGREGRKDDGQDRTGHAFLRTPFTTARWGDEDPIASQFREELKMPLKHLLTTTPAGTLLAGAA